MSDTDDLFGLGVNNHEVQASAATIQVRRQHTSKQTYIQSTNYITILNTMYHSHYQQGLVHILHGGNLNFSLLLYTSKNTYSRA